MILYGIPNCTTVKKARAWLDAAGHAYHFHDFRKQGVDPAWLARVAAAVGWQTLLNTRGTTWRRLDPTEQARATGSDSALALMHAHPSLIKRPVLERDGRWLVGFSETGYADFCR